MGLTDVEQTATRATINAKFKAAIEGKGLNMEDFAEFAKLLRESRADNLPLEKFNAFFAQGCFGDNLDLWKDEKKDKDQMLVEFDKEFEKFTPVAQSGYGSPGMPVIGQPPTPIAYTPPTATTIGASLGNGAAESGGGGRVDAKNPTTLLSKNNKLTSQVSKLYLENGDPILNDLKEAKKCMTELEEMEKPTIANNDPVLDKQVETARTLASATEKHRKEVEAVINGLQLTIDDTEALSFAAKSKIGDLNTQLTKIQTALKNESTKMEAYNKKLATLREDMEAKNAAMELAKAAIDSDTQRGLDADLALLQTRQNELANSGKTSKEEVTAKKKGLKECLLRIKRDNDAMKDVVVGKYTKTNKEKVRVLYMGDGLDTIEIKTNRNGEITLTTTGLTSSTANRNCGYRRTFASLTGDKIDLATVKAKTVAPAKVDDKTVGDSTTPDVSPVNLAKNPKTNTIHSGSDDDHGSDGVSDDEQGSGDDEGPPRLPVKGKKRTRTDDQGSDDDEGSSASGKGKKRTKISPSVREPNSTKKPLSGVQERRAGKETAAKRG